VFWNSKFSLGTHGKKSVHFYVFAVLISSDLYNFQHELLPFLEEQTFISLLLRNHSFVCSSTLQVLVHADKVILLDRARLSWTRIGCSVLNAPGYVFFYTMSELLLCFSPAVACNRETPLLFCTIWGLGRGESKEEERGEEPIFYFGKKGRFFIIWF
jgi:hypothetical protein